MRKYLLTIAAVTALAGGCSRVDERSASSGSGSPAGATPALGVRTTATGAPALSPPRRHGAFASLPDRGVLLAIDTRQAPRRTRAYTFHPVQVSEEHALRAIATGTMAIPTPDGSVLRLRYERHYEHPDGNWTWVGRPDGAAPGTEAILTFGEKAVFGTIPDGDRPPFLLSMIDGRAWMVRTDVKGLASLDAEATRPTRPDHLLPPRLLGGGAEQGAPRSAGETRVAAGAGAVANAAPASMTVDVVLGYTTGFATRLGGQSQANTRLAHIVAVTNEAYNNSQIDAAVRLVRTVQVDYPDATKNQDALYDLSGVSCTEQSNGSLSCTSKPVPASLQPLLAARDQYGGDLVSLVRNFNRPENEGCGIAWLIGGGQDPISTADAGAGISIVSDSNLNQFPDDGYICRDETLAHELGHNMGSQHDRAEADGNDNVLQANEYGRYPYSFGYKTSSGSGNFYTVMAYGDSGQIRYRVFSNPNITSCGDFACGIPDQADNARSLRQTMPVVATFRATVVPNQNTSGAGMIRGMGGKCLDARNYGTAPGTVIQVWDCLGGAQQLWRFSDENDALVREGTSRVLDVAGYGTSNGSQIQLWDALNGANQAWYFANAAVVSANGGRVLDAIGVSSANGTKIQLWDDVGGRNQRWTLRPDGSLVGIDGKCLDVEGFSTANGTRVQLWACTGAANQKWRLGPNGSIVGYGGKCLDAANAGSGNGTLIQMWDCHGGANQAWRLRGEIRSVASNRCLDDPGMGSTNGMRVHIWDCHGGANQRWEFSPSGT